MKLKSNGYWLIYIVVALLVLFAASMTLGITTAESSVSGLSRSADVGCL